VTYTFFSPSRAVPSMVVHSWEARVERMYFCTHCRQCSHRSLVTVTTTIDIEYLLYRMNGVRANVVPMMTVCPRTANPHAYRSMGTKIPRMKVYHDRNDYQTFHSTERKKECTVHSKRCKALVNPTVHDWLSPEPSMGSLSVRTPCYMQEIREIL